MISSFLKMAEIVLDDIGHSMSSRDIYNHGREKGLIKSKGKTPENTLRARLSEDLIEKGNASIFIRTAANKFGLRKWIYSDNNIVEYIAPKFEKDYRSENVVCIKKVVLVYP